MQGDTCIVCGRVLTARKKQYCSAECRMRARSMREYPDAVHVGDTTWCKLCGTEFVKRSNRQLYCSRLCYIRAKYPERHRIGEVMYCAVCKEPFVRTAPSSKYCSDACRKFAMKKQRMGLR